MNNKKTIPNLLRTKKKLYISGGIAFIFLVIGAVSFQIFSKNLVEEVIDICIKNKENEANFFGEDFSELCTCSMEGLWNILSKDEYKKMLKSMQIGKDSPQTYAFLSTISKEKKEMYGNLFKTCALEYMPMKAHFANNILTCMNNTGQSRDKCQCLHMSFLKVLGERRYKLITLSTDKEELKNISFEEMIKIDSEETKCKSERESYSP